MSDALEEHEGNVSIGGRNITNLRFADDIDALAEEIQEQEALVECHDKTCAMKINAENTKLMIWQTAQMASRGRSKLKGISLEQLQASSILEELFQMKTKNKYCTGHCCSDKAEAYFDGSKAGPRSAVGRAPDS